MSAAPCDEFQDDGSLVLEQRFAIVPEWVIDADISDSAFRLYSVLLRYGQSSGQRMPGRALLARRLHKSCDTVDRALKELVPVGAVVVEHRRQGQLNLTNRYHVMSTPPNAREVPQVGGSRKSAATPGGRKSAARVAAPVRPNPVVPTETTPPPSPSPASRSPRTSTKLDANGSPADEALLDACGITDLGEFADMCQQLRRRAGRPTARWSAPRLSAALHEAVDVRGWPAKAAAPALLAVAADPATQGPMRLACPGPWWDAGEQLAGPTGDPDGIELAELEHRLVEADGRRVWVQQRAREDLSAERRPITRLAIARRACQLLDALEATPC
jgi:hypothetical protein